MNKEQQNQQGTPSTGELDLWDQISDWWNERKNPNLTLSLAATEEAKKESREETTDPIFDNSTKKGTLLFTEEEHTEEIDLFDSTSLWLKKQKTPVGRALFNGLIVLAVIALIIGLEEWARTPDVTLPATTTATAPAAETTAPTAAAAVEPTEIKRIDPMSEEGQALIKKGLEEWQAKNNQALPENVAPAVETDQPKTTGEVTAEEAAPAPDKVLPQSYPRRASTSNATYPEQLPHWQNPYNSGGPLDLDHPSLLNHYRQANKKKLSETRQSKKSVVTKEVYNDGHTITVRETTHSKSVSLPPPPVVSDPDDPALRDYYKQLNKAYSSRQ